MNSQETAHVREILTFFFPHTPPPVTISDELAKFAAELYAEALRGSHAIDLLPRVPGFIPGPGWLVSQAVQIAWRQTGKQRIYEMVRARIALNKRTEYALLLSGAY